MKNVYGRIYNYFPLTFILPNEYSRFIDTFMHQDYKKCVWICKPSASSRGRGIYLLSGISELNYSTQVVVQRYLPDPYLIGGYKWDLRIYVLVTSVCPLRIYIYNEGLCRFSTEKFDMAGIDNMFSHLTNTSINKHAPNVHTNKSVVGTGSKWSLAQLKAHLESKNKNWDMLWFKIKLIAMTTFINMPSSVPDYSHCFELFGIDIIVDSKLKPWLLEVNCEPALSVDSYVDQVLKPQLIRDTIQALEFKDYAQWVKQEEDNRFQSKYQRSHYFR